MRVADIMTKKVISVHPDDLIEDVAKMITERHLSGVFVTQDGKLLGQISHRHVLEKIFPTYEEFYNDLAHNIDFEEIQTRARELAGRTAREVMTGDVETVGPDVHVMKVAAWMLLRDVHRLAVVDADDRLIGVVSRGDIFYHTINRELNGRAAKAKRRGRKLVGA